MWDLAGVYASMARTLNHQSANHGKIDPNDFHPPNYISNPSTIKPLNPLTPPLDATSIWFTFQAMQEVMRPGEEGLWQQFSSSQKIAWKTGTSFGFRDGNNGYGRHHGVGKSTGRFGEPIRSAKAAARCRAEFLRVKGKFQSESR